MSDQAEVQVHERKHKKKDKKSHKHRKAEEDESPRSHADDDESTKGVVYPYELLLSRVHDLINGTNKDFAAKKNVVITPPEVDLCIYLFIFI
jgi:translation initiation factor 2 subunit 2